MLARAAIALFPAVLAAQTFEVVSIHASAPFGRAAAERIGLDPRPTVFDAVRQQLGLRLEPRKGQVEIVVIDRAARPDGN